MQKIKLVFLSAIFFLNCLAVDEVVPAQTEAVVPKERVTKKSRWQKLKKPVAYTLATAAVIFGLWWLNRSLKSRGRIPEGNLDKLRRSDQELADQTCRDAENLRDILEDLRRGVWPEAGSDSDSDSSESKARPPLGSGYYAAQGALAEEEMNARFARERAAEQARRPQGLVPWVKSWFGAWPEPTVDDLLRDARAAARRRPARTAEYLDAQALDGLRRRGVDPATVASVAAEIQRARTAQNQASSASQEAATAPSSAAAGVPVDPAHPVLASVAEGLRRTQADARNLGRDVRRDARAAGAPVSDSDPIDDIIAGARAAQQIREEVAANRRGTAEGPTLAERIIAGASAQQDFYDRANVRRRNEAIAELPWHQRPLARAGLIDVQFVRIQDEPKR